MKNVIIAEKPSVAQSIAAIVGAGQRKDGYLEGNGYAVTWAFGHLVGLAMPETYGFTGFRREHLPILPAKFTLVPRQVREGKEYRDDPGVVRQLNIIKGLFEGCDRIIVATDAGREGELIYRYIYCYLGCTKPFVRLWISSLTDKAIREGMERLQPGSDYDNLYLSAKARSEADWLIGINGSQALSLAAGRGVFSLGRVQTPTLAMICSRYLENKSFTPKKSMQIRVTVEKDGIAFQATTEQRYEDKAAADGALGDMKACGTLRVTALARREVKEEPPLLYDLTALQRDANTRLDFSADRTLS
ncbi:DNA topoisomerase, partial [Phocaeicola barnesiae]